MEDKSKVTLFSKFMRSAVFLKCMYDGRCLKWIVIKIHGSIAVRNLKLLYLLEFVF